MTQAPETPGVVIGNHTAKYTAKNPAIKWLTERFVARLDGMIGDIAADVKPATNPLEVGAGEGVISQKLHSRFGRAVGLDLPDAGLRELARASSRHLLLSVPREPYFRGSNLVTGRYLKDLGNTPGHLNHWTKAGFQRFVSQVGTVRAVASPYPWTIVWATL